VLGKNVTKKILDDIEDDIQIRLDDLFDRITYYVKREMTQFKEVQLRAVCVDYAHVDADVIHGVYDKLLEAAFDEENLQFYFESWKKQMGR
jgi:hypothetical protein